MDELACDFDPRGLLKYERHHLVYVADVTYVDGVRPVSVIASELWLSSIAVLMTSDNFKAFWCTETRLSSSGQPVFLIRPGLLAKGISLYITRDASLRFGGQTQASDIVLSSSAISSPTRTV